MSIQFFVIGLLGLGLKRFCYELFLISMAWWEGVDEIHLLIAPANYYWIPWPYVSFTFSTFTSKKHIFH